MLQRKIIQSFLPLLEGNLFELLAWANGFLLVNHHQGELPPPTQKSSSRVDNLYRLRAREIRSLEMGSSPVCTCESKSSWISEMREGSFRGFRVLVDNVTVIIFVLCKCVHFNDFILHKQRVNSFSFQPKQTIVYNIETINFSAPFSSRFAEYCLP